VNLVLLGPPGAGKGTQAVRIAKSFGLMHLSSGDILRAERKEKTQLGLKAQEYMDRGALVPDDVILSMMEVRIGSIGEGNGFLLDGFPRTLTQARGLDERLNRRRRKVDLVVNIEVDDAEVVKRLSGRWSCPTDGRVYHEMFSPPAKAGKCDVCGAALTRRRDDEPDVVEQRLKTYHAETEPLVSYYRSTGVLRSVSGMAPVEQVESEIGKVCRAV
jgi:adenylate kinase